MQGALKLYDAANFEGVYKDEGRCSFIPQICSRFSLYAGRHGKKE